MAISVELVRDNLSAILDRKTARLAKLRELYNKDKDFYFGIIERVNDEYQLRLKERQYIKTLNPKYNVKKYWQIISYMI